jgi:hypothetical protein
MGGNDEGDHRSIIAEPAGAMAMRRDSDADLR